MISYRIRRDGDIPYVSPFTMSNTVSQTQLGYTCNQNTDNGELVKISVTYLWTYLEKYDDDANFSSFVTYKYADNGGNKCPNSYYSFKDNEGNVTSVKEEIGCYRCPATEFQTKISWDKYGQRADYWTFGGEDCQKGCTQSVSEVIYATPFKTTVSFTTSTIKTLTSAQWRIWTSETSNVDTTVGTTIKIGTVIKPTTTQTKTVDTVQGASSLATIKGVSTVEKNSVIGYVSEKQEYFDGQASCNSVIYDTLVELERNEILWYNANNNLNKDIYDISDFKSVKYPATVTVSAVTATRKGATAENVTSNFSTTKETFANKPYLFRKSSTAKTYSTLAGFGDVSFPITTKGSTELWKELGISNINLVRLKTAGTNVNTENCPCVVKTVGTITVAQGSNFVEEYFTTSTCTRIINSKTNVSESYEGYTQSSAYTWTEKYSKQLKKFPQRYAPTEIKTVHSRAQALLSKPNVYGIFVTASPNLTLSSISYASVIQNVTVIVPTVISLNDDKTVSIGLEGLILSSTKSSMQSTNKITIIDTSSYKFVSNGNVPSFTTVADAERGGEIVNHTLVMPEIIGGYRGWLTNFCMGGYSPNKNSNSPMKRKLYPGTYSTIKDEQNKGIITVENIIEDLPLSPIFIWPLNRKFYTQMGREFNNYYRTTNAYDNNFFTVADYVEPIKALRFFGSQHLVGGYNLAGSTQEFDYQNVYSVMGYNNPIGQYIQEIQETKNYDWRNREGNWPTP